MLHFVSLGPPQGSVEASAAVSPVAAFFRSEVRATVSGVTSCSGSTGRCTPSSRRGTSSILSFPESSAVSSVRAVVTQSQREILPTERAPGARQPQPSHKAYRLYGETLANPVMLRTLGIVSASAGWCDLATRDARVILRPMGMVSALAILAWGAGLEVVGKLTFTANGFSGKDRTTERTARGKDGRHVVRAGSSRIVIVPRFCPATGSPRDSVLQAAYAVLLCPFRADSPGEYGTGFSPNNQPSDHPEEPPFNPRRETLNADNRPDVHGRDRPRHRNVGSASLSGGRLRRRHPWFPVDRQRDAYCAGEPKDTLWMKGADR